PDHQRWSLLRPVRSPGRLRARASQWAGGQARGPAGLRRLYWLLHRASPALRGRQWLIVSDGLYRSALLAGIVMTRRWTEMQDTIAIGALLVLAAGVFALMVLGIRLGGVRQSGQLRRKDERRHAEQLDWRRTGQLPARYVTIYD